MDILKDIRRLFDMETRFEQVRSPELDLLGEEYAVTAGHPKIGDFSHRPRPCYFDTADMEFAQQIRKACTREELSPIICNHLSLFRIHVKWNADALLLERLYEVIEFCKRKEYEDLKMFCTISIHQRTHEFFVSSLFRTPMETYAFFRELVLSHAVEHPPFSYEVFTSIEASELLTDFCKRYLRHLPLIRYICLPTFSLRINSCTIVDDKINEESTDTKEQQESPQV